MLTVALTATICGAESCIDFADFARDREALVREFLDLPWGSRLVHLLDPAAFATCFAQFLDGHRRLPCHCEGETARLITDRGGTGCSC